MITVAGYAVSWWQQFILVCLVLTGAGMVARGLWRGLGQVRDWWHDRRRDRFDEDDFIEVGPLWAPDDLPPLPPERSWEQMTSHQLPVEPPTGPLSVNRERIAPLLGSRQAIAHFRRLEKARQRRFMVVSAEIWRAYAAAGLEGTGFTRAMAARVRELTP